MRPTDIRDHLRKQPFEPFRVHISDGSTYEIRHPELMHVTRTEVIISLKLGRDDMPERNVYCDPVHITRIEQVNGTDDPRNPQKAN